MVKSEPFNQFGRYGVSVMQELLANVGSEGLPLLGRAVAVAALTLIGGAAEVSAFSSLLDGALAVGLWKLYVGGVALYAGLFVLGPEVLEALEETPDGSA